MILFRRHILRDAEGRPYLIRYILLKSRRLSVYLHNIVAPDHAPHLHSHPWTWARALILRGGYTEEIPDAFRMYYAGNVNRLSQTSLHRIDYVLPNTWTLFIAGEDVQPWGFLVDGKTISRQEYQALGGRG